VLPLILQRQCANNELGARTNEKISGKTASNGGRMTFSQTDSPRRQSIIHHSVASTSNRSGMAPTSEAAAPIKQLAKQAANFALEKKGENIKLFDLRSLTSITDFFVICTGSTDTHVKAIADHIVERLEAQKITPWHVEGLDSLRWVLLDYVDFVVHVFQPEIREYYSLERLWGDAIIEEIQDDVP